MVFTPYYWACFIVFLKKYSKLRCVPKTFFAQESLMAFSASTLRIFKLFVRLLSVASKEFSCQHNWKSRRPNRQRTHHERLRLRRQDGWFCAKLDGWGCTVATNVIVWCNPSAFVWFRPSVLCRAGKLPRTPEKLGRPRGVVGLVSGSAAYGWASA